MSEAREKDSGGDAGTGDSGGLDATRSAPDAATSTVVPVVAEAWRVEKRSVVRGGLRLRKTVGTRTELVDVPLFEERTEVERVPVNQYVDAAPPVRYEGDVLVIPILEEIVVVEKRLIVREELRIRKWSVETHKPQPIILRREEVEIERFDRDESGHTDR